MWAAGVGGRGVGGREKRGQSTVAGSCGSHTGAVTLRAPDTLSHAVVLSNETIWATGMISHFAMAFFVFSEERVNKQTNKQTNKKARVQNLEEFPPGGSACCGVMLRTATWISTLCDIF